jgi:hypothetical protein
MILPAWMSWSTCKQSERIAFGERLAEVHDDVFDPYEQALLWTDAEVGIVVTEDEQMHVVAISDHAVTDCVGG